MRVLYVCPTIPTEPFNGYEAILYHRLRCLEGIVEAVGVFCTANADLSEAQRAVLARFRKYGLVRRRRTAVACELVGAFLSGRPLQTGLFSQKEIAEMVSGFVGEFKPDIIDVFMMRMAPAVSRIREVPIIYSLVDSMYSNLISRSMRAKGVEAILARFEAKRSRIYENQLARSRCPLVLVSTRDADLLRAEGGLVEEIPIGVDTAEFSPIPLYAASEDRYDVVFSGHMYYDPNARAVEWFVKGCWPLIRKRFPEAIFAIAGNRPPPHILQLHGVDGIEVLGRVVSMADVLRSAKVAVAPMQSGSGLQFKVLEALSCERPVVATLQALAGFGSNRPRGVVLAEDEGATAREVCRLLDSPEVRVRMGAEGREDVVKHFGWQRQAERALGLYQQTIVAFKDRTILGSSSQLGTETGNTNGP